MRSLIEGAGICVAMGLALLTGGLYFSNGSRAPSLGLRVVVAARLLSWACVAKDAPPASSAPVNAMPIVMWLMIPLKCFIYSLRNYCTRDSVGGNRSWLFCG